MKIAMDVLNQSIAKDKRQMLFNKRQSQRTKTKIKAKDEDH